MKDSVLVLCVICNAAEARRSGPECRRCYKTNMQRKYRHDNPNEDSVQMITFSLDQHMYEVDKMAYREWFDDQ